MAECIIVDDLYEQEDWFRVFFIAPHNGEDLHDLGLINYAWSISALPQKGTTDIFEKIDNNREAHLLYSHNVELGDENIGLEYTVEVTAKDLRFLSLDITDTEQAVVVMDIPCIEEGNRPDFTINNSVQTEALTGTVNLVFTVTASEAIRGRGIDIDYCTEDITASSTSTSVEVQHIAYDKNLPPEPFISLLDFGNVRAVFDASFPKFYNVRYSDPTYSNAWKLLTNTIGWLNTKGGSKVLFVGDKESGAYSIKDTDASGFYNSIRPAIAAIGYTVDTKWHGEVGAIAGQPSDAEMMEYDVIVFMSSVYAPIGTNVLHPNFVSAVESAVRQSVGILIITDHTSGGSSFAAAGNQIANRFFAEFTGSIDRTVGTDFDEIRATYGDHPLIAGITGTMPGDSSEGKIETNNQVMVADYQQTCGTLTIAEGATTGTISVPINADTIFENEETFKMTLSNATRGTISDPLGIGTIKEAVIPELKVELSTSAPAKQLFVYRDISGSTYMEGSTTGNWNNPEVTVNSMLKSRFYMMGQIIEDYALASCPSREDNVRCTDLSNSDKIKYDEVLGASLAKSVYYIRDEVMPFITPEMEEVTIFIMNDSSDGRGVIEGSSNPMNENTAWQTELAAFPTNIPITLVIVRCCGSQFLTKPAFVAADDFFTTFLNAAPPNVTGLFKTFSEYTTGADGELNTILDSTLNNQYSVECNVNLGSISYVEAPDLTSAEALAASTVSCP